MDREMGVLASCLDFFWMRMEGEAEFFWGELEWIGVQTTTTPDSSLEYVHYNYQIWKG